MLFNGHCSHVQNGKATPSEQRNGSKDWPKIGAERAGPPFSVFQVGSCQWISIYKNLSGSFHVFPMKHGVSCNLFTDWLVKSENFAWEEASEAVGGSEHCGKRNPRVDHRFHLYLAIRGRAPFLETHVITGSDSSFWACASGFEGKHQVIPYADGSIMVYSWYFD